MGYGSLEGTMKQKKTKERRDSSRNEVFTETDVLFIYRDNIDPLKPRNRKARGKVSNLGSGGMLLLTDAMLPVGQRIAFKVDFMFGSSSGPSLEGTGRVLRSDEKGYGIRFIDIDVDQLRMCVIWMIDCQ
jgi:hypothetical protein